VAWEVPHAVSQGALPENIGLPERSQVRSNKLKNRRRNKFYYTALSLAIKKFDYMQIPIDKIGIKIYN